MKILGIDPGLRQMGWAVLQVKAGKNTALGSGVLRTQSTDHLSKRLLMLYQGLCEVIESYAPDEAAVEETFVNTDPRGALKLGHARAIALLVPAKFGLNVAEYAANQIKKTVVGSGHADKSQVEFMMKRQIQNADPKTPDETDAFAIALTHFFLRKLKQEVTA